MDPQRLTNEQLPAYAHGSFLSYGCCLSTVRKDFYLFSAANYLR